MSNTIKTKSDFRNLKKGQWFTDGSGVYEVTEIYNPSTDFIGIAEVIFEDDESDNYHLENENKTIVFSDVKNAELM